MSEESKAQHLRGKDALGPVSWEDAARGGGAGS